MKRIISSILVGVICVSLIFMFSLPSARAESPPYHFSLLPPDIAGLDVTINGGANYEGSGVTVTGFSFDWGDTTTENGWFPLTHSYSSSGPYVVTVTAHFSDSHDETVVTMVNIVDTVYPIYLLPPTISGSDVEINGVALYSGPGTVTVTGMDFDWGDGSQTNDEWFPQTHAYASNGPHTVTVTAHYSDGHTSSAATIVNLDDLIALLPPIIKPGFQVEINGVALPGDEVEYIFWDWGDGTGSYGGFIQNHIYSAPGTYTVKVMACFEDGSTVGTSTIAAIPPTSVVPEAPGGVITLLLSAFAGFATWSYIKRPKIASYK